MIDGEVIIQIESTPAGLIGLSNEGKVYLYNNGKWDKF